MVHGKRCIPVDLNLKKIENNKRTRNAVNDESFIRSLLAPSVLTRIEDRLHIIIRKEEEKEGKAELAS